MVERQRCDQRDAGGMYIVEYLLLLRMRFQYFYFYFYFGSRARIEVIDRRAHLSAAHGLHLLGAWREDQLSLRVL